MCRSTFWLRWVASPRTSCVRRPGSLTMPGLLKCSASCSVRFSEESGFSSCTEPSIRELTKRKPTLAKALLTEGSVSWL